MIVSDHIGVAYHQTINRVDITSYSGIVWAVLSSLDLRRKGDYSLVHGNV